MNVKNKHDLFDISNNTYSNRIFIVDGYSANGKLLISKFLQTFDNVQKMEVDHIFTEIGALNLLNKIEKSAAINLLNVKANNTLTNNMLSRETNFRFGDESSIFKTEKKIEYIKRLFIKDGDHIHSLIKKQKPILHIMTHFSKIFVDIYFDAFKDKLNFISCVRHPVYYFDHWRYILKNIISGNQRMYGIGISKNGLYLPWYMKNLVEFEKINNQNIDDMIIDTIICLDQESKNSIKNLASNHQNKLIEIPFEKFILNSNEYIKKIEEYLNIKSSFRTKKFLKKENLPMQYFSERKMKRTNFKYKIDRYSRETQVDFEKKLDIIKGNTNKEYFDKFLNICTLYENKFKINYISTLKYQNR